MPRATPTQVSFTAGEISPFLFGRTDLVKYQSGAALLKNFIVLPQGPIMRRKGTKYVAEVKDYRKKTRLVPFIFSQDDKYLLEFGPLYVRVYHNDVLVAVDGGEVTTTYAEDELHELCFAQSADTLFISHENHKPAKLQRSSETAWTLTELDLIDGPYRDPNDDPDHKLTISNVSKNRIKILAASDLFNDTHIGLIVEFNVNDVYRIGKILAVDDARTAWIGGSVYDATLLLEESVFTVIDVDGTLVIGANAPVFHPYAGGHYVRATINGLWWLLDNTGGGVDNIPGSTKYHGSNVVYTPLGATVAIGDREIDTTVTSNKPLFAATDIGRHLRLNFNGKQTWGKITGFTSTTEVSVSFEEELPRDQKNVSTLSMGGTTSDWRIGAWSSTSGWPSVVCLHEQRALFAATREQPQTLWFSEVDDYESFSPTDFTSAVLDSNAVTYTIASVEQNRITWAITGPTLLVGSTGGEWQGKAATTINEPITPKNLVLTQQSPEGSQIGSLARRVGSATLFISNSGRRISEMVYSFENDSFVTKDLTIFSSHILPAGGGAAEFVYQKDTNSTLWVRLNDGTLAACTYVRDQEVVAWHRHVVEWGTVESLAVLPRSSGNKDSIYMIVTDGSRKFIEKLDPEFDTKLSADPAEVTFLDSWITRRVSLGEVLTASVYGLEHLEGKTVRAVVDGKDAGDFVVSGGTISVAPLAPLEYVTVGFPYRSDVCTLPTEAGSVTGSAQIKLGRADEIGVRLWKSVAFSYSNDYSWNGDVVDSVEYPHDDPVNYQSFFSGDVKFSPNQSYDLRNAIRLFTSRPYPLNIISIAFEGKTNE